MLKESQKEGISTSLFVMALSLRTEQARADFGRAFREGGAFFRSERVIPAKKMSGVSGQLRTKPF